MFAAMHENMGALDGNCRICVRCHAMLPHSEFFVYRDTGEPRAACKKCSAALLAASAQSSKQQEGE